MQYKKIIIFSIVFVLAASLFAYGKWQGGAADSYDDEVNRYVYPADCSDCLFITQRLARGKIPEEILSEMNVEELVWAVIDYPFLLNAGLSSYRDLESKSWLDCDLIKDSDAFQKLMECKKPEGKIIKVLKEAEEEAANGNGKGDVYTARWVFYDAHEKGYFHFSKKQLDFLSKP